MSNSIYSDLYKNLTTSPDFCNKTVQILKDIELADKAGNQEAVKQHVQELLELCDYNPSLLVPYFFPRFPEFEPMTLWTRPHAFSMMALTLLGSCTIQASRQCGKCLDKDVTVRARVKGSGVEKDITIGDLFNKAKLQASSVHHS